MCVSRAWGLQSKEDAEKNNDIVYVTERPKEKQTPPPFLRLGFVAPASALSGHTMKSISRTEVVSLVDFGNGTMSDLGSHWNDLPFWALKLDAPLTIEAHSEMPARLEDRAGINDGGL